MKMFCKGPGALMPIGLQHQHYLQLIRFIDWHEAYVSCLFKMFSADKTSGYLL